MRPLLESEFHHDGRGPELQAIIWRGAVLVGFEYFNPEDVYEEESLKHLRIVRPEAYAFAGEEVHGSIVHTDGSKAAIHDLGATPWLKSFSQCHLTGCSHFQIMFYDEIFDIVGERIEAGLGRFPDEAQPNLPLQRTTFGRRRAAIPLGTRVEGGRTQ